MKIKTGNTRFDIIANYGPLLRFVAQMATGQTKDAKGKIKDADREQVVINFIKSKRSPLIGLISEVSTGKKYSGQKIEGISGMTSVMLDHVIYMWITDAIDAFKDVSKRLDLGSAMGWGTAAGAASWAGEGVQTYAPTPKKHNR